MSDPPGRPGVPLPRARIGCAGWSIPSGRAGDFPAEGTHLERYARRFSAVEVNSSFHRPHRPTTYARWAASTPEGFAFSLKVPREITHDRRLAGDFEGLDRFLDETAALGPKRGPLLVQLPPSLAFDPEIAASFFEGLRGRHAGPVACEPRHPSWFAPEAGRILADRGIARVAADPAVVPEAAEPGGASVLLYRRLHGSPRVYHSAYPAPFLDDLAARVADEAGRGPVWCIFDNTASGAATADALALADRIRDRAGT